MRKILIFIPAAVLAGCAEEPQLITPDAPVMVTTPEKGHVLNQCDMNGYKQGWWVVYGMDLPEAGLPADAIAECGDYRDDRRNGIWTFYNVDGTASAERNYLNDSLNGLSKIYDYEKNKVTEMLYDQGILVSETTRNIAAVEVPHQSKEADSAELKHFWTEFVVPFQLKEELRIREIICCPLQGDWADAAIIHRSKNQPNGDYFFANYDAVFTPAIRAMLQNKTWQDVQCYKRSAYSEVRVVSIGTDSDNAGIVLRYYNRKYGWELSSIQVTG